MQLTRKQEEGLKIAVDRYKRHEPWTCIAGYAGTGKSTLVRFIIQALNLRPDEVVYIAYTGKASLVLEEKGCPNAMTAHRLLYKSYPRANGTFYNRPKKYLPSEYKLIVVDEVSMLPKEMWELLLSHHKHVIALGDPGQLPPVKSIDNEVLNHPHIFLDEIMRQAQESEIIRLTMGIREGKPLPLHNGDEVVIVDQKDFVDGMCSWADQIITGKNETRKNINFIMREKIFGDGSLMPQDGDKVICTQNDWYNPNAAFEVLVNGSIGYIHNPVLIHEDQIPNVLVCDYLNENYEDIWQVFTNTENLQLPIANNVFWSQRLDYELLTTGIPFINKKNWRTIPMEIRPKAFEYGYAITCHKSQGSEYSKVLVLDEPLYSIDHTKWLYTAATRAKDKLVIVRNYR